MRGVTISMQSPRTQFVIHVENEYEEIYCSEFRHEILDPLRQLYFKYHEHNKLLKIYKQNSLLENHHTKERDLMDENGRGMYQLKQEDRFQDEYDLDNEPLHGYIIKGILGKGAYGKVYLVKKDNVLYAMKALRKDRLIKGAHGDYFIKQAEKEMSILKKGHPFFVKLKDTFETQYRIYFVMDLVRGGDLYDLFKGNTAGEELAKFYIRVIAIGIMCLHETGVIHRDLKLDNILLGANGYPLIADPGLAKHINSHDEVATTIVGTVHYKAPEVYQRNYGKEADWWSLGVILYIMLVGHYPYNKFPPNIVDELVQDQSIPVDIPEELDVSKECIDFLTKLLQKDPTNRLGFGEQGSEDVIKHPWLAINNEIVNDLLKFKVEPIHKPENLTDAEFISKCT